MSTIKKSDYENNNIIKTNLINKNNRKIPGNNKIKKDNNNSQKNNSLKSKTDQKSISAIKRPLRIDNSNNIFYINHKGKNKSIKINPGEYNLTELRNTIKDRVNEKFGIGKVKVDLTGSGADRLIQAKDGNIFDFLI